MQVLLEVRNALLELFDQNKGSNGLPTLVDWRSWGAVIEVEDQGRCGICWVFACKAVVEGINAIHTRSLIQLSAQQLIDYVDVNYYGWSGGSVSRAFHYIIAKGSLESNHIYPYEGLQKIYKPIIVGHYFDLFI